jgi:hypothetical protein
MALKFGTFMAPFHPPGAGRNPSTAYERDVAVLQHMDRLGFDEAWIGEHHSCGTELQSGGFGSYLLIHHEWARHAETLRSYELFADHVMPRFQGSADRILAAEEYARSRWDELDGRQGAAIAAATVRHAKERAGAQA